MEVGIRNGKKERREIKRKEFKKFPFLPQEFCATFIQEILRE
jgi:hypothetical protein